MKLRPNRKESPRIERPPPNQLPFTHAHFLKGLNASTNLQRLPRATVNQWKRCMLAPTLRDCCPCEGLKGSESLSRHQTLFMLLFFQTVLFVCLWHQTLNMHFYMFVYRNVQLVRHMKVFDLKTNMSFKSFVLFPVCC